MLPPTAADARAAMVSVYRIDRAAHAQAVVGLPVTQSAVDGGRDRAMWTIDCERRRRCSSNPWRAL